MRTSLIVAAAVLGLAILPAAAQAPDQHAQPCPGAPSSTAGTGAQQNGPAADMPANRQGVGQGGTQQANGGGRPDLPAANAPKDGRDTAANTECAKETNPLESPRRQQ